MELQKQLPGQRVNGQVNSGTPYPVTGCYLQKFIFNEENDGKKQI